MRTSDIEIAVASHFNWRQNIIVPNVSWGLFGDGREIDLAIVRPSGWLVEVEIKITASDIKADLRKRHWRLNMQQKDKPTHWHKYIKQSWFAVPHDVGNQELIPEYCGILQVQSSHIHPGEFEVRTICAPRVNPDAVKLTPEQISTVLRLGTMRIWTLRDALRRRQQKQ